MKQGFLERSSRGEYHIWHRTAERTDTTSHAKARYLLCSSSASARAPDSVPFGNRLAPCNDPARSLLGRDKYITSPRSLSPLCLAFIVNSFNIPQPFSPFDFCEAQNELSTSTIA